MEATVFIAKKKRKAEVEFAFCSYKKPSVISVDKLH